jgi:hypothetical protein
MYVVDSIHWGRVDTGNLILGVSINLYFSPGSKWV